VPTYKKITFVIDGFTPDTLPLGRLAEYIKNFANLVGPNSDVRFQRVGKGSAALINRAPQETVPDVRARITAAQRGDGPKEAVGGLVGLKGLLVQDRTSGRIKEERRKIIEFPKPTIPQYGPVYEEGTLEGVVIRIGGKDQTIHIHLMDGERVYSCHTTDIAKAKALRPYLLEYEKPIRLSGKGKWSRSPNGAWELLDFKIADYEVLSNDELQQVLERMRQIPGSGWDKIDDPLSEMDGIRKGSNKIQ
jgi:hypothetical protein